MHIPLQFLSMLGLHAATPSLEASAANILFRITLNLELFELSADTTYDLYLYAVTSDRVSRRRLLPPEYPFIRNMYGSDKPDHKCHRQCPGVAVRVWGHAPTLSAPLSTLSLIWWNLKNCCGVISVSNCYSFLPVLIYIRALYILGPLGIICVIYCYYSYRFPGLSNIS
jgi:hypothetical protein